MEHFYGDLSNAEILKLVDTTINHFHQKQESVAMYSTVHFY